MSFPLVTELELDSQVWMAQGELLIRHIEDFEEFTIGVFLSYLQFCISNKISKCGSLRSCGKGRESYSTNTGALFLLQYLHWSSHILVRLQQLVVE